MRKFDAKFIKLPKSLLPLIMLLLVLLALSLLIVAWYNHKITKIQDEEIRLRKNLSGLIPNHNNLSN